LHGRLAATPLLLLLLLASAISTTCAVPTTCERKTALALNHSFMFVPSLSW
jgi:hypothetical protein